MAVEATTRTIVVTTLDDHVTVIEADAYQWYYEFFLVYTSTSMDYFDRDNIKSIVVDGREVELPT